MLSSPQDVLNSLGSESKYRSLLRRIASNPPFSHLTSEIQNSSFLLAYTLTYQDSGSPDSGTFELAKAKDIYIVDNSFFGRMFPVKRAPHESDLEDFYVKLGSSYISKSVDRRFEVVGKPQSDTPLTNALKQRILERGPLLVSPSVTSRPLASNASALLSDSRLSILEAAKLMAVYSLNGVTRRNATSCFSRPLGKHVNAIYVVSGFDWFDVGYAVGDLVLKRCQLEDAFFISSLLEAPVEQLRARGFPVDRIVRTEPPPAPPLPPPPPPPKPAPEPSANIDANVSAVTSGDGRIESGQGTESKTEVNGEPGMEEHAVPISPPDGVSGHGTSGLNHEGFEQILKQIYPHVNPSYLRSLLGKDPNLDEVQRIAEELSAGKYPRDDDSVSETASVTSNGTRQTSLDNAVSLPKRNKSGLRQKLGRAFNGIRGSSVGAAAAIGGPLSGGGVSGAAGPSPHGSFVREESQGLVPSVSDAQSQNQLEQVLKCAVQSSSQVNQQGINSNDSAVVTSIPKGLDRGETCEMMPGHSLQPLAGPTGGNLKTQNGIRVFSARGVPESESFLRLHPHVVESFSQVLGRLCGVYGLSQSTIAIFHDPRGGTIAFNANRALHFNVRFYHNLHFNNRGNSNGEGSDGGSLADCYCYWFVTMAHELAHHMVSAHNKEHGFYTESYVTIYLPKLLAVLNGLSNR